MADGSLLSTVSRQKGSEADARFLQNGNNSYSCDTTIYLFVTFCCVCVFEKPFWSVQFAVCLLIIFSWVKTVGTSPQYHLPKTLLSLITMPSLQQSTGAGKAAKFVAANPLGPMANPFQGLVVRLIHFFLFTFDCN